MNIDFLSAVIFVAVFAVVILIHELGHFVVGRLFKVEIEEFGIGIPPKMLTLFHWQGTEFTLNWLPFGGFNRFKGENDPDVPGGLAAASAGVRLAVLLAGATMNLLFGALVFSIIFSQVGLPDFGTAQLYEISPNSPAEQSGLLPDDIVLSINGETFTIERSASMLIAEHLDEEIALTILRDDKTFDILATPDSSRSREEGALGVAIGPTYLPPTSWFETLPYSFMATYEQARTILLLPVQMITGELGADEGRFIGFKGIYNIFQQTVDRDVESRNDVPSASSDAESPTFLTLQTIAMLTITLGVFNLLPLPALDGGRILFVLIEIIARRRVPAKFENIVHAVGMLLLLGLMFYINIMDFVNPVEIIIP